MVIPMLFTSHRESHTAWVVMLEDPPASAAELLPPDSAPPAPEAPFSIAVMTVGTGEERKVFLD